MHIERAIFFESILQGLDLANAIENAMLYFDDLQINSAAMQIQMRGDNDV